MDVMNREQTVCGRGPSEDNPDALYSYSSPSSTLQTFL